MEHVQNMCKSVRVYNLELNVRGKWKMSIFPVLFCAMSSVKASFKYVCHLFFRKSKGTRL